MMASVTSIIPGNVLVIDNKFDDVRELLQSLWAEGQGLIFSEAIPEEGAVPPNVRVVVLDLVLRDDGDVEQSDYQQAALLLDRLYRKTHVYLVAVWTVHVHEDDEEDEQLVIDELKQAYQDVTGVKMPEQIAVRAFGKVLSCTELLEQIQQWIDAKPEIGLIFQWERGLELARDTALTSIFVDEAGIRTAIAQIGEELGTDAIPREFSRLLTKLLSRFLAREVEANRGTFVELVSAIEGTAKPTADASEWYARFHNLLAYFEPSADEPPWTGDIYDTGEDDLERRYAIVITPACDLAQQKVTNFRLASCTSFSELHDYAPEDDDVPIAVRKLKKPRANKYRTRKDAAKTLIRGGSSLPSHLYVLHFVDVGGAMVHVIVDFTMVYHRSFGPLPADWQRICRVDSPFVEDLLQKYSAFSSRIGVPDLPEEVKSQEEDRLGGESS